jgi:xanthine dehydrogenase accessory factor
MAMDQATNLSNPIATAARLQESGVAFALVTVVRAEAPASAHPGDKAVVTADGSIHGWVGGGCAQPVVEKTVRQALADGRARLVRISPSQAGERDLGEVLEFGMACHSGGTLELFIDPVLPHPQLLVFGDSPVAHALARLGPHVGFAVTVAAYGAHGADFPSARRVFDTDDAEHLGAQPVRGAYVVVATQGRRDLQALRAALALDARLISFVASARKASVLKESLRAAGADRAAVDSIAAPAGYPIAASTPEEIALSILAALVAHRRGTTSASAGTPRDEAGASEASAHAASGVAAGAAPWAASISRARTAAPAAGDSGGCCHAAAAQSRAPAELDAGLDSKSDAEASAEAKPSGGHGSCCGG